MQIDKIEKNNDENKNNLDNVQRLNITINAENFSKKIIEIPILVHYTVDFGGGGGIGG